jgi:glycosyltransferase involved in cell wall biosynthesis
VVPAGLGHGAALESRWIAAAAMAEALGRHYGGARIITPHGEYDPNSAAALALKAELGDASRSPLARLPSAIRPLLGDVREWIRGHRFARESRNVDLSGTRVVVQLHHRFQPSGERLARRGGAPYVARVEALEVREEAAWGISRRGLGPLVERFGEIRRLKRADLVVPVSSELDALLEDAGIDRDRRFVVPNGVDVELFAPGPSNGSIRKSIGGEGRFLVGWVGGFRPFHGLEIVPEIARRLAGRSSNVTLCLLGTGRLRSSLASELQGLETWARILPPVAHPEIPSWLRAFDACLLLGSDGPFHYSPLKLFEYLACGRPVIAARVGQVKELVVDGEQAVLVPPGDPQAVIEATDRLQDDPALRGRLASAGRDLAVGSASWGIRATALYDELQRRFG